MLFDTGAKGNVLLYNMEKLGIDPTSIDAVFISHAHWDHTGGLDALLLINPDLEVYGPTFSSKPLEIFPSFFTTGSLSKGGIREQSLIARTKKGLIVITGCSHPGLENILSTARSFGEIHAVIGGFHGFSRFEALKEASIIVPCHCTSYKQRIKELYPEAFRKCGVGKEIEI